MESSSPNSCGSVGWALPAKRKVAGSTPFGHMPEVHARGNQVMFLSSFSCRFPLSKNKYIKSFLKMKSSKTIL